MLENVAWVKLATLSLNFRLQIQLKVCLSNLGEVQKEHLIPVDTRTKNVRTKDVHKRKFIFGAIWKHGKTFQSERLMNVSMWYI